MSQSKNICSLKWYNWNFHLNDKFGKNGYAKFFFKDEEYGKFLTEIRDLLLDKDKFIETHKNYINDLKAKGVIK